MIMKKLLVLTAMIVSTVSFCKTIKLKAFLDEELKLQLIQVDKEACKPSLRFRKV